MNLHKTGWCIKFKMLLALPGCWKYLAIVRPDILQGTINLELSVCVFN